MNYDSLITELLSLDRYEKVAKAHFLQYGKPINASQFILLYTSPDSIRAPEDFYTKQSLIRQNEIKRSMATTIFNMTLQTQSYLPEDSDIEIQKLMRFVDIQQHQHEFIECSYVLCGQCIHKINDNSYTQKAGDLFTIPNGFLHTIIAHEDSLCLTVKFRTKSFLEMELPNKARYLYPLAFSCNDDLFVQNTLLTLWHQQTQQKPYFEAVMRKLLDVLFLYLEQNYSEDAKHLVDDAVRAPQVVEVLSYMMDNYQTVTLQSAAQHFHYNHAYLSRIIHEQTGKTFSSILKEYKLHQAARILSEHHCKINDVCERVGYKDPTQFIRSFKALYGMTPARYRKQADGTS